jgi:hypothetical protein
MPPKKIEKREIKPLYTIDEKLKWWEYKEYTE